MHRTANKHQLLRNVELHVKLTLDTDGYRTLPGKTLNFTLDVVWLFPECSMNVHHKCQKKVANLCGVNQKLMAEALAIIESKQQVIERLGRLSVTLPQSTAFTHVLPLPIRPEAPKTRTSLVEKVQWASVSRECSERRPG